MADPGILMWGLVMYLGDDPRKCGGKLRIEAIEGTFMGE